MAPKRKQPTDERPSAETLPPRRATRQHPVTTQEPPKQLRSGRTRADTSERPSSQSTKRKSDAQEVTTRSASREGLRRTTAIPPPSIPSSPEQASKATKVPAPQPQLQTTRQTRREPVLPQTSPPQTRILQKPTETPISPPKHPLQVQHEHVGPSPGKPPSSHSQPVTQTRVLPPKPDVGQPNRVRHERATSPAATQTGTGLSIPSPILKTTPKRPTHLSKPPSTPGPDRNIDKVFLGNICFRAWYPSYYPKEVLADSSGNAGGREVGKVGGGKHNAPQPILERLLVCPCCFKYSRELVTWWEHVRYCERKAHVPGRKVYTHPRKGVRRLKTHRIGETENGATASTKTRRKGQADAQVGDAEHGPDSIGLDEQGEWSVWEVDGEKEGLFCQNLSLFAKLFLDNKSVFFDVTGFNYFLLVYTPPKNPESSTEARTDSTSAEKKQPFANRPHIVGFFSKEKVSWDNNNLACILVFPPWQRKGLGSLLMGVSYAISRREGILGGPEKPISELGRKGYKRYWAAEIARWLLSIPVPVSRPDRRRPAKDDKADDEVIVDISECSEATWIVPEDCLQILREMGILEEAGLGPDKGSRQHVTGADGGDGTLDGKSHGASFTGVDTSAGLSNGSGGTGAAAAAADGDADGLANLVPRVRVDKAAVQSWIEANRINLERACDPDGLLPGYAIRETENHE